MDQSGKQTDRRFGHSVVPSVIRGVESGGILTAADAAEKGRAARAVVAEILRPAEGLRGGHAAETRLPGRVLQFAVQLRIIDRGGKNILLPAVEADACLRRELCGSGFYVSDKLPEIRVVPGPERQVDLSAARRDPEGAGAGR